MYVCALIWQQHMRTSTYHSHDRNVFLHGSTECCLSFDLDVRSSNWHFFYCIDPFTATTFTHSFSLAVCPFWSLSRSLRFHRFFGIKIFTFFNVLLIKNGTKIRLFFFFGFNLFILYNGKFHDTFHINFFPLFVLSFAHVNCFYPLFVNKGIHSELDNAMKKLNARSNVIPYSDDAISHTVKPNKNC